MWWSLCYKNALVGRRIKIMNDKKLEKIAIEMTDIILEKGMVIEVL